jgi:hypothetical protein
MSSPNQSKSRAQAQTLREQASGFCQNQAVLRRAPSNARITSLNSLRNLCVLLDELAKPIVGQPSRFV